ncbi:MAG: uracil-DNA glycosylase [Breznakia sp.]
MKDWHEFLIQEQKKDYFIKLMNRLEIEAQEIPIYPPKSDMFACFDLCPYENVKVVILGQDPYHKKGQAHGLCFSVCDNIKIPPSLKNIYKELHHDLGIDIPNHGNLTSWAKQGVLLMNTSWSVREGKPGSHQSYGWQTFTNHVLQVLNAYDKPIVFLLWGNHAKVVARQIDNPKHLLLKAAHPSPLAGGAFFNSKPFSQANAFLKKQKRGTIDWQIKDIHTLF